MTPLYAGHDPEEDFSALIGLAPSEAEAKSGSTIRATVRDGKYLIVTCDYRLDRINVSVRDGVITSVSGRG